MLVLVAALLWAGLIGLLLGRAFRQYRSFPSLQDFPEEPGTAPFVTFIVPARNESKNIGRCLHGLLGQRYPRSHYEIVVIDDGSIDDTAEIVTAFSRDASNVHLLRAGALPAGWTGKTHACWGGACSPHAARAEWLCFVDADTVATPNFLPAAIRYATVGGKDMYSICPRQEIATVWERLFFPVGFVMVSFFQDLRSANDPNSPVAAANGQCLIVRRSAYFASGGHSAVAQDVCEDSALAARMKATGHGFGIVGGEQFIRTRLYGGWLALCEGLGKNLVEVFGGLVPTLAAIALAIILAIGTVALPVLTFGTPVAFAIAMLASAALLATNVRAAHYFKTPVWYAMLFPAGYAIGIAIAVMAIVCGQRGAVAWKGRMIQCQPPARARWNNILRVAARIRLTWVRR
ncbi:MAG: glycosyltransferase [Vulcanimicrobiaceae bacterium]